VSDTGLPIINELTDDVMRTQLRIAELFRDLDDEVPGQLVSTFLYIASHNPCHMQAIQDALRVSPNSVSRCTDWLSKYHRLGKPGMDLVVKFTDPQNARRRMVKLTPRGERLVIKIKEILNDH